MSLYVEYHIITKMRNAHILTRLLKYDWLPGSMAARQLRDC